MSVETNITPEQIADLGDPDLKIIITGDSACGKTKLVERFLSDK